jgi:hypothetical protein
MAPILKVHLEQIEHGGLIVELKTAEQQLSFVASDFLYDSLEELVEALFNFLKSQRETTARWTTEPTEYDFTFSLDIESGRLAVLEYPDNGRTQRTGRVAFEVFDTPLALALPFWRALRRLEAQPNFQQGWRRPFPIRAMQLLSNKLAAMKSPHP